MRSANLLLRALLLACVLVACLPAHAGAAPAAQDAPPLDPHTRAAIERGAARVAGSTGLGGAPRVTPQPAAQSAEPQWTTVEAGGVSLDLPADWYVETEAGDALILFEDFESGLVGFLQYPTDDFPGLFLLALLGPLAVDFAPTLDPGTAVLASVPLTLTQGLPAARTDFLEKPGGHVAAFVPFVTGYDGFLLIVTAPEDTWLRVSPLVTHIVSTLRVDDALVEIARVPPAGAAVHDRRGSFGLQVPGGWFWAHSPDRISPLTLFDPTSRVVMPAGVVPFDPGPVVRDSFHALAAGYVTEEAVAGRIARELEAAQGLEIDGVPVYYDSAETRVFRSLTPGILGYLRTVNRLDTGGAEIPFITYAAVFEEGIAKIDLIGDMAAIEALEPTIRSMAAGFELHTSPAPLQ